MLLQDSSAELARRAVPGYRNCRGKPRPNQPREATIWLDGAALGLHAGELSAGFPVTDELTGAQYRWGQANYVRLDPAVAPAHIFTVPGIPIAPA